MSIRPRKSYFAYGSNIRIAQMADRCPSSLFKGSATLTGHRWQINERGVAKIVESPPDCVEGLLFSIEESDEKILDRNEGVRLGFYEKRKMLVVCRGLPHGPLKTTYLARQMEDGPCRARYLAQQQQDEETSAGREAKKAMYALVYVSSQYVQDGFIREEFADRMKAAMADASLLGVSRQYLGRFFYPAVYGLTMRTEQVAAQIRDRPTKDRGRAQVTPGAIRIRMQPDDRDAPVRHVPKLSVLRKPAPVRSTSRRPNDLPIHVRNHVSEERMSPPPQMYALTRPLRSRSADAASRRVHIADNVWRQKMVLSTLKPIRSGHHAFYTPLIR